MHRYTIGEALLFVLDQALPDVRSSRSFGDSARMRAVVMRYASGDTFVGMASDFGVKRQRVHAIYWQAIYRTRQYANLLRTAHGMTAPGMAYRPTIFEVLPVDNPYIRDAFLGSYP